MKTVTSTVPADGTDTTSTTKTSFVERAKQQVKDVVRAKAADLGSKAKTDAKSLWYRNRRQLVPVKAAAAFAATGTTGAVIAEHPDIADLAVSGGTGAVALSGGYLALRHAADRIPAAFAGRVKTGLAVGCVWCAALPLTGTDATSMWLALGLGTVSLSAKWWQRIRPGYPAAPAAAADRAVGDGQPIEVEVDPAPVSTSLIIERWVKSIARKGGPLPESQIELPRRLDHGRAFPVQLDPGVQTVEAARNVLDRIATGLRIPAAKLAIEPATEDDPSKVELRVVDSSPVLKGVAYQGPRIVTDDEGVHIVLGPYADGDGEAKFTVFTEDSMRSGFIFGGTGAGKSRVVELIAIALRKLGVQIWYLDPQEGQSSPALMELADWALPGLGSDEDPTANIEKLVRAMKRGMRYRSRRLAVDREKGFQHSRKMPGVMVIIDEASDVFSTQDAKGITYGARFGEISKKIRKNGIGILAVGHIYTLPTFGNDKMLRSSLTMYNLIALKTTEKSDSSLLPNGMPDPTVLPMLPGFGYIKSVASPRVAQFRAEKVEDPERWLAELSSYDLDSGTAHAVGDDYVRRHEIAEEHLARLEQELAALENGELDLDDEDKPTPATTKTGSLLSLPLLGGNTTAQTPPSSVITDDGPVPARPLTEREQDLMDLLADGGEWSTNDMAQHLGVSVQRVRQLVTRLESRLVLVRKGVYRAKHL